MLAVCGAAAAAFLMRGPQEKPIAAEHAEKAIPESAVAALQGGDQLPAGPHGDLPPGHPKIDRPGAAGELPEGETEMPDDDTHRGLSGAAGATPAPAAAAADDPKPGEIPLASGANGKRIAELFAQRKALAGKLVRVHGQVVKVAAGIMGTNFVHLRDGSGSPKSSDHDLTITIDQPPEKGQRVIVEGTVKVDHDLGAGYLYPVLLEKAVRVSE
jgi:hypothetical protein